MILGITPNLTSSTQSNSNKVSFSSNFILEMIERQPKAGEKAMQLAGLTEDTFGHLVEGAKGICGEDTFVLKRIVTDSWDLVAAVTHTPAKTTKHLSEVTYPCPPDSTGEIAIQNWMQSRHQEWLEYNHTV